jgi:hypothetical protein
MIGGLPPHVRRFLRTDVDSLEGLEVLLLLRTDPGRRWAFEEIVSEMRSTPYAIRGRLQMLVRRRLVRNDDDGWRYDANAKAEAVIADVCTCYQKFPLRVIEALYGDRDDPMRAFADAFRFREEDEEEDEDDAP